MWRERLINIFKRDESGRRPVFGGAEKFQNDPHWRDYLLFYEHFHGDNGAGSGREPSDRLDGAGREPDRRVAAVNPLWRTLLACRVETHLDAFHSSVGIDKLVDAAR